MKANKFEKTNVFMLYSGRGIFVRNGTPWQVFQMFFFAPARKVDFLFGAN